MPEKGVESLPHKEILSFEEIIKVCKAMSSLGVRKVKLTGGEPLVRKNFIELVRAMKQIEGIDEITLTTNGLLLEDQIGELVKAGISSINISLDTLDRERFKAITRVDGLTSVLNSIHKAAACKSLKSVKVNVLAAKDFNGEDLMGLMALAKKEPIHVRFIEVMPIGLGKNMKSIQKSELMQLIENQYGPLKPYKGRLGNGPSRYYELEGFVGKIGFISAVSECFCENCNRVRLTADGFLKLCLHSAKGTDLKALLRAGISQEDLKYKIQEAIQIKPERHHFNETQQDDDEQKVMAQIGG